MISWYRNCMNISLHVSWRKWYVCYVSMFMCSDLGMCVCVLWGLLNSLDPSNILSAYVCMLTVMCNSSEFRCWKNHCFWKRALKIWDVLDGNVVAQQLFVIWNHTFRFICFSVFHYWGLQSPLHWQTADGHKIQRFFVSENRRMDFVSGVPSRRQHVAVNEHVVPENCQPQIGRQHHDKWELIFIKYYSAT